MTHDLFPGFEAEHVATRMGRWFARIGGPRTGEPVLLLHGFPQTHAMWHRIAPRLAERFRVICLDLKGYGDSDPAPDGAGPDAYAKRTLGREVAAIMAGLGHARFRAVGHDRGARVATRLALDDPDRIVRLALLDIVPNHVQWQRIEADPAPYRHWRFLSEPAPSPERAIGRNPDAYFEGLLAEWSRADLADVFDARALDAYRASWRRPEVVHAMCQDYRAGAGTDRDADIADLEAGRVLRPPVLILSGAKFLDASPEPALAAWRRTFAPHAEGAPLPGGHFIAEEVPDAVLACLMPFLAAG